MNVQLKCFRKISINTAVCAITSVRYQRHRMISLAKLLSVCLLQMLTDGLECCDVFISCLDSHSDGTHSLQSTSNDWKHGNANHFILLFLCDSFKLIYEHAMLSLSSRRGESDSRSNEENIRFFSPHWKHPCCKYSTSMLITRYVFHL